MVHCTVSPYTWKCSGHVSGALSSLTEYSVVLDIKLAFRWDPVPPWGLSGLWAFAHAILPTPEHSSPPQTPCLSQPVSSRLPFTLQFPAEYHSFGKSSLYLSSRPHPRYLVGAVTASCTSSPIACIKVQCLPVCLSILTVGPRRAGTCLVRWWMDGRMNGMDGWWVGGWKDVWLGGWVGQRIGGWKDTRMNE